MATVGKNAAAPLLVINIVMYVIVIGFASWCLNHFINGETNHPGLAGNGATFCFLVFATLAGVIGATSKLSGAYHIRVWRTDTLASAASSAAIAWAITALAFGVACKEIHLGGYRGWRLRVLEAFIIILAFTQLLYVLLLHAGMISSKYGPRYRDPNYGVGAGAGAGAGGGEEVAKGTARI